MMHKEIYKVDIYSDIIKAYLKKNKTSIRGLVKEIGDISEAQIHRYLKQERMPPLLLSRICQILKINPPEVIVGATLWIRIGVRVPITNDELFELMEKSAEPYSRGFNFDDLDFNTLEDSNIIEYFKRGVPDGETYIPGGSFDEWQELYWLKKYGEDDKEEIEK